MLYFKDAGDVLQSAVLTGWAMHVSILAEEDAVKGSATRAAMLKESIFYYDMMDWRRMALYEMCIQVLGSLRVQSCNAVQQWVASTGKVSSGLICPGDSYQLVLGSRVRDPCVECLWQAYAVHAEAHDRRVYLSWHPNGDSRNEGFHTIGLFSR